MNKPIIRKKRLTEKDINYFQEKQKCPICLDGRMLSGPCGGLSQNILCENCCTEFTCSPVRFTLMAYDLERAYSVYGAEPKVSFSVSEDGTEAIVPVKSKPKLVVWAEAYRKSWREFWRG